MLQCIADVHSTEFVSLEVHLCCRIDTEFCSDILLESECGQEVRLYRLKFWGDSQEMPCGPRSCRKGCDEDLEIPESPCAGCDIPDHPHGGKRETISKSKRSRR